MPYDGDVQDFKTTFKTVKLLPTQVRQDLEAARALLAKGWCQGKPEAWDEVKNTQSYCLVGALASVAAGASGLDYKRYARCSEVLMENLGLTSINGSRSLVLFNDAPYRTHVEVLQVFDDVLGADG